MTGIFFEILIILLLILLNGVFAMTEIAVVSARRARLRNMADQGERGAEAALALSEAPNKLLSTVQVGITLVGIFAGAFGGATLAEELVPFLEPLPVIGAYAATVSFFIVAGTITYLTVVIGELVPKRIALENAERIAASVARPMQTLSTLATPIVRLLSLSTDGVLKLLRIEASEESSVTEEEIRVMVEEAGQAGMIEEAEREMVQSVFRLNDRPLEAMMTPRPEIVWLDINAPPERIRDIVERSSHSRFPVCDGDLDHVLGIVHAKDLLSDCLAGETLDLQDAIVDPLFMAESVLALNALERFRQGGMHMALLVDEYGGIEGMVTLIDILEAIVGDIPTADELREPPIVQREDGSYLVDGLLSIEDFKQVFEFTAMPGEGRYQTLGGFIVYMIGHLPVSSEHFGWGGLRFEVADMDGQRVDKVIVEQPPEPPEMPEPDTEGEA